MEYATIGRRNLKIKDIHWEQLVTTNDENCSYKIKKPIVLCFSGNGTITSDYSNWLCKIAANLIGAKDSKNKLDSFEDVDFLGVVYGTTSNNKIGSLSGADFEFFINKLISPLFYDKNGDLQNDENISKNLSQITFFSFCFGAEEVYLFCQKLYKKLTALGFTYDQINTIMSSMIHLSYAPSTHSSYVPMISVLSLKDMVYGVNLANYNFDKAKNKIRVLKGNSGNDFNNTIVLDEIRADARIGKFYDEIAVFAEDLSDGQNNDEHNPINISRTHENWNPTTKTEASDCVSQMLGYALAMSVVNGINNNKSKRYVPKPSLKSYKKEMLAIMKGFDKENKCREYYEKS